MLSELFPSERSSVSCFSSVNGAAFSATVAAPFRTLIWPTLVLFVNQTTSWPIPKLSPHTVPQVSYEEAQAKFAQALSVTTYNSARPRFLYFEMEKGKHERVQFAAYAAWIEKVHKTATYPEWRLKTPPQPREHCQQMSPVNSRPPLRLGGTYSYLSFLVGIAVQWAERIMR
jgi:hypothetical protein